MVANSRIGHFWWGAGYLHGSEWFPHRLLLSYKDSNSNCIAEKSDNTLTKWSDLTSPMKGRWMPSASRYDVQRRTQYGSYNIQTGMHDLNLKMMNHQIDPSEECPVKKQGALLFKNVNVKKGEEGWGSSWLKEVKDRTTECSTGP